MGSLSSANAPQPCNHDVENRHMPVKRPDKNNGRRTAIRIAVLLLYAAAPAAVLADPTQSASGPARPASVAPVQRHMSVSLADLDLTTAVGARAAQERLHQAARRLCFELADSEDLGHQPHFVECVEQALAGALRQLPRPALVAKGVQKPDPQPHD
jgi:UrcA family protein